MKKIQILLVFCLLVQLLFGSSLFFAPQKAEAAGFDYNNLCSDGAFRNSSTLDANGIQNFLNSKGSFLRNFSEGGKSAAQIIYEAARGNTMNPYAILAMIQKEEGLITGAYSTSFNQTRVDWAMGYGYTDGGVMEQYKGFTTQIHSGTWQLKNNYDVWAANGSIWNVGKTMVIDGVSVRFANRCTSALYRYTPHLGTNFTYYFNLWNGSAGGGNYDAAYVTQGPRTGAGAPGVNLAPNQRFMIWVNYRNTGDKIWYRTASVNSVRIGTSDPQDRGSTFMGGKNLRGSLVQAAVAPGATGTFQIWLTAPSQAGTYTERFKPVVEGIKWMGNDATWVFNVAGGRGAATTTSTAPSSNASTGTSIAADYNAQYITQGPRSGPGSPGYTLLRNQTAILWVNYRNTGNKTWYQAGPNPTYLGTANPQDRNSDFFEGNNRRSRLVQVAVPPGATGTFLVYIKAPSTAGTYTETFRPVTEYITWMGDTASWSFTVK